MRDGASHFLLKCVCIPLDTGAPPEDLASLVVAFGDEQSVAHHIRKQSCLVCQSTTIDDQTSLGDSHICSFEVCLKQRFHLSGRALDCTFEDRCARVLPL